MEGSTSQSVAVTVNGHPRGQPAQRARCGHARDESAQRQRIAGVMAFCQSPLLRAAKRAQGEGLNGGGRAGGGRGAAAQGHGWG